MAEQGKDEGTNGNGGEENKGVSSKDFNALVDTVKQLATSVQDSQKGQVQLMETIKGLSKPPKETPTTKEPKGAELLDEVKLERMSRSDLVKTILAQVKGVVDEAVKPLGETIQNTRKETVKDKVAAEMKSLADKNPDFNEWMDEIKEIAQQTPGISVTRAFKLAKSENPDKAKQLEEKYKDEFAALDGSAGTGDTKGKPYGGAKPGVTTSGEEGRTDMSRKDAIDAAWEETMGSLPGIDEDPFANPN